MKRWNKVIEKLTVKQCKKIIVLVVSCAFVFSVYAFLKIYYKEAIEKILMFIGASIFLMFSAGGLTWLILGVERKELFEKEEKIKPELREKFALKTNEFVEVLYAPKDNSKSLQESVQISQKLGAKYFVKEREDFKAIIVVVKNDKGEELQEPQEVNNYIYFNNNYKPKE